jgi:hypothetical protein
MTRLSNSSNNQPQRAAIRQFGHYDKNGGSDGLREYYSLRPKLEMDVVGNRFQSKAENVSGDEANLDPHCWQSPRTGIYGFDAVRCDCLKLKNRVGRAAGQCARRLWDIVDLH